MFKTPFVIFILALSLIITACSPAAERSAGMALENAGSVVKSGSDKLFIEATPEPTPNRY